MAMDLVEPKIFLIKINHSISKQCGVLIGSNVMSKQGIEPGA